ncbi:DUF262 domain-containing protein [Microvirga tunisiensis]|uniref:DUF262 domain-containing protein n=1 Tax=Microvirga tunisiensis TaxID=2108360 RepID=UPI00138704F3|nr:DUF262 domain-containing protein [Microvirga tunisiensis]
MPTDTYSRFRDIPQLTANGRYSVDLSWGDLFEDLARWERAPGGVEYEPDFQRGHVWSEGQQVAFVEFALRGGLDRSSRHLLFNCVDWDGDCKSPIQLVDGLQRLTATKAFLSGKIRAFGRRYHEFQDRLPRSIRFTAHVNDLPTRSAVLNWYLELNAGGIAHSPEEIERVRELLHQAS